MGAAYSKFAWFYDKLQQDVPYARMAELFHELISEYSSEKEVVLDLACGTGNLSAELAKLGYDVIGVDLSQDMLNEAIDKKYGSGQNIQYLCQDMTELDLYGAADAIICVLDSLNHLESSEALDRTFQRVSMFTCDGGLFIFDMNTEYKHREILGDNSFIYDMEGLFCCWQNELNDDGSVNIFLDFFEEEEDGRYSRYSESFTERIFDVSSTEKSLEKYGFEMIGKFDGFSRNPVNEKSQRIMYVCKRKNR